MSTQLSSLTRKKLNKALSKEIDMALKRRARTIIQETYPNPGEKILEAGCGPGYYLNLIKKVSKGVDLYGIDFDLEALKRARKIVTKKNRIIAADLTKKLPFKSSFFDKIIVSEVLEHIPRDLDALKELKRVLKNGGKVVITVPNHNYPLFWDPVNWILEKLFGFHVKSGFFAGIWSNHVRLYKPKEIQRKVSKFFKIEKIESMTWWCLPFNHNLLYGGKMNMLPKDYSNRILRSMKGGNWFIGLILWLINLNDKINDHITTRNSGVGLLVVAEKTK